MRRYIILRALENRVLCRVNGLVIHLWGAGGLKQGGWDVGRLSKGLGGWGLGPGVLGGLELRGMGWTFVQTF